MSRAADTPTGLVKADGQAITSGEVRRARASALAGTSFRDRDARRNGTFTRHWRPMLRSADADWLVDRDEVVAQSRDVGRNDQVGAAAAARRVNQAIGFQWRLSSRVNARALGITVEAARALRAEIEAKFRPYAYGVTYSADAERKKTFGQLLRLNGFHLFQDGETLSLVEYAEDEPTKFKTRMRVVDPDRLSNPNGLPETDYLRGGVERNTSMVPIAYHIREGHPNDLGSSTHMRWIRWPRYSTNLGRPQVLHAFDETRAGQSRGVTRFVSALKSFRALSKYTDATLESAALNALWLGYIKSSAGPDAISESFAPDDYGDWSTERADWYAKNPVTFDGAELPVLDPSDEVEISTASKDTTGFDAFTRSILRLIAAALGVTYEELSMDFSQTNYSSARAALAVAWNETLAFRGLIKAQIADPFFVAWLEEAFDLGAENGGIDIPEGAPDFYDAIDAYAECVWIGPGRGYIDPTKEIAAAAARIELGVSTLEKECADNGEDWEEMLEERAYELQRERELGMERGESGLQLVAEEGTPQEQDRARDERPAPAVKRGALGRLGAFAGSALARVRALADSPEHNAALDARPGPQRDKP